MRTKKEILKDSLIAQQRTPPRDNTASVHEQLTMEILIDIRDELTALKNIMGHVGKVTYLDE